MQAVNCLWGMVRQKCDHLYEQFVEVVHDKFPNIQVVYTNWDIDLVTACEEIWPQGTRGTWYCYLKV